jgi:butyryl-CoA dehydrogenase
MDFLFTEEQVLLRNMVKEFTDEEVRPRAAEADKTHKLDKNILKKAADLGLFGVLYPEEYSGGGMGEVGYCIVLEELSKGCGSFAATLGISQGIGAMAIYLAGNEEQKQKYLKPCATGEKIAAFAITEPDCGSDVTNLQTTAIEDGDYYIVNGAKQFITNGSFADVITVFASTDRSLGAKGYIALIVEKDTLGFKVGKLENKMGIRACETAQLFFEDMKVPKSNLLGKIGDGYRIALNVLDFGRVSLGAQCLGPAKEALRLALEHSSNRIQFGKPINRNQGVQFMLAEMATTVYAMESMVYRTAWMVDSGLPFSREAAMNKLFITEALNSVVDKALQIHGGYGYTKDYAIERIYRDARINRIVEGSSEIQKIVIANDLIRSMKI